MAKLELPIEIQEKQDRLRTKLQQEQIRVNNEYRRSILERKMSENK